MVCKVINCVCFSTKRCSWARGSGKKSFKNIDDEVKETNCNAYIVPLEKTAPMTSDFRGLINRLDEMVLADPKKLENVVTSNSSSHDYPDKISFTGSPLLDPITTSSCEVLEAAKRRKNTNENHLDKSKNYYFFDGCNQNVVPKELEFFEKFRGEEPAPAPGYLPVPINHLDNLEQMPRLLEVLSSTSMSVVRGLGDVIGLNPDDFLIETLAKVLHDYDLICLRQMPQKATTNYWSVQLKGKKRPNPREWACYDAHHTKKLDEFSEYYETIQDLVREAILQLNNNLEEVEKIIEELANKMKESSMSMGGIDGRCHNGRIRYQYEFDGFYDLVETSSDGCGTLLNFAGEMIDGLNKPQMYLKLPGARTTGHLENNCLASLNYNMAPEDCVWYGVPMEYAAEFQKIIAKKMSLLTMLVEQFWSCEEEILKARIPLQMFIQKPGELDYVGIGTYHWVQSNGFARNLKWNLATPTFTELAVAAACYDHYVANKYSSEYCLEMVMQRAEMDEKMKKLVKSILMRSVKNAVKYSSIMSPLSSSKSTFQNKKGKPANGASD
ncbi:hypothetical protein CRE_29123 [Caenorhabditis remanei]|uniref:JmjC domain-containing protein n=1 Tax=Caenorhabditis remanei TaxID=31234 RepID=E3N4N0_CAERE|nr:hypothetical protein CRE_29123 [Caenorhabditis remanei]